MLVLATDDHRPHRDGRGLHDGQWIEVPEIPERVDAILEHLRAEGADRITEPPEADRSIIERIHDPALVEVLAGAWEAWTGERSGEQASPCLWPRPGLDHEPPADVEGRLGAFCFDAGTPIGPGTWPAALRAADVALAGATAIASGELAALALCRPPGHHAMRAAFGGYCYLNNAALAAQHLIEDGADRIAVLDVDYHHGNGTQDVFYERADVLVVSLHADPAHEYPWFSGHASETGRGRGEGANLNLPLPAGTDGPAFLEATETGLERIEKHDPAVLVVSLGLDALEHDPLGRFTLSIEDFGRLGERLGRFSGPERPMLLVLEGGYAVEHLGPAVSAVLRGVEAYLGT